MKKPDNDCVTLKHHKPKGKRSKRGRSNQRIVYNIRVDALNKLFSYRYGNGDRACWQFPDDDAGLEDLPVLLQQVALSKPEAVLRVIKIRAPWLDENRAAPSW